LTALQNKVAGTQLILGTQWGDEGKGKIVDLLGHDADLVARYQGGHNAGHTVKFGDETYVLHLIPTGILRPDTECLIGNGVVIDPKALLAEVAELEGKNINVGNRIKISRFAHFILPYHNLLEACLEDSSNCGKIGTTGRGIGPAYADKIYRRGLRVEDVIDPDRMKTKVIGLVENYNRLLQGAYGISGVNIDDVLTVLNQFRDRFKDCIADTTGIILKAIDAGKNILIEGAQGALLDVDFGTYPFVTSSNTTAGGVSTGLGLSLRKVDKIIGVIKAYSTRVGNGPFPTELLDDMGESLRAAGHEYGATTGRPRRCGWFDAVVARYSMQINDIDALALTKLDVLDGIEEIKICNGYRYNDSIISNWFDACAFWEDVEPVYETMPGWTKPVAGLKSYDDFPVEAKKYISRLKELLGVEIMLISTGPKRSETILL